MSQMKQHHFVLVHGAGHGAWCWVRVASALEKVGNRVTALDLVSAGDSPVMADDVTSLKQYTQPLEDLFASFPDDEKVILVGHSMGGMSLTYLSELFPKKISVAVYLAAYMPPPGVDLFEILVNDPAFRPAVPVEWEYGFKVEGGPPTSLGFPASALKEGLYNKCSPEDLALAEARVRPFPFVGPLYVPIHGTKENYGSVPRILVIPVHDQIICPPAFFKFVEINKPTEVIQIDADHGLFFSGVDKVKEILIDAAVKYDS